MSLHAVTLYYIVVAHSCLPHTPRLFPPEKEPGYAANMYKANTCCVLQGMKTWAVAINEASG